MAKVAVVSYDPGWPAEFESAALQIRVALAPHLYELHHIGSTSVPGLAAKPVIDMLAAVADINALESCNAKMGAAGYEALGEFGIPGRRYFRRNNPAGQRTHQVHAFALGSPHITRHLAFRDFLRAHRDAAEQYAELKRRLAEAHPHDIEAYMDGKDAWIKQTEAAALAWSTHLTTPRSGS